VTSLLAVFEAATRVKLTLLIQSCLKTRKKENMEIKVILHKSPSKRSFRHRIHSLQRRADARWSADIVYCIWRILLVCRSGIVIEVKSRSRIEYLIPTNNIIVLDSYFNLTNKFNLFDRLLYDLIRFIDHLVVAYFFGHPVYSHWESQVAFSQISHKTWRKFV